MTLGGYTDWRVPTIDELFDIMDYSQTRLRINPTFVNTSYGDYFSQTEQVTSSNSVHDVSYKDGITGSQSKGNAVYIRCVRDSI